MDRGPKCRPEEIDPASRCCLEAKSRAATWAEREQLWSSSLRRSLSSKASMLARQPLILSGHGMALRINHGALEVRNGFTHYPQAREEWRFFRGDPKLPPRIILLDGSGGITLDVLAWLAEQNIPLIQLDWRGNVVVAAIPQLPR